MSMSLFNPKFAVPALGMLVLGIGAITGGGSLLTRAATPVLLQGDINGDGKVDIFDLSILLSNYGKTSTTVTPVPTAPATPLRTNSPTPSSPTPPISGRLIFGDDAINNLNLQMAVPGRISATSNPVIDGKLGIHFQVRNGENWSGDVGKNRSEALIDKVHGYNPQEGDDIWHRWWFQIPDTVQLPRVAKENIHMTQMNQNTTNVEHLAGMTFRVEALTFVNDGGTLWSLPANQFVRNRWYKVLFHSHFSASAAKGYDELWIDDQQKTTVKARTLSPGGNYFKFGLYRMDNNQGTADEYVDGMRVGTTRAVVDTPAVRQ